MEVRITWQMSLVGTSVKSASPLATLAYPWLKLAQGDFDPNTPSHSAKLQTLNKLLSTAVSTVLELRLVYGYVKSDIGQSCWVRVRAWGRVQKLENARIKDHTARSFTGI